MKILFSIILLTGLGLLGFFGYVIAKKNQGSNGEVVVNEKADASNVSNVEGTQIVDIRAKAGYTPRVSTVKAGVPTVLRFNTNGTFDCSSQVRIPSLNITKSLPQSGVTEIELGSLPKGVLKGSCGMGMYPFQINAE